jgi:hypothetical protein
MLRSCLSPPFSVGGETKTGEPGVPVPPFQGRLDRIAGLGAIRVLGADGIGYSAARASPAGMSADGAVAGTTVT